MSSKNASFITDIEVGASPQEVEEVDSITDSKRSISGSAKNIVSKETGAVSGAIQDTEEAKSEAEAIIDNHPFKKTFSRNGMSGFVNSTRSENELKRATLSVPRGLKFKTSNGPNSYKVPRNLKEASISIKSLNEGNEESKKLLDNLSLDLEVLLGNKAAVSAVLESSSAGKTSEIKVAGELVIH